jgi:hypothetical protein
MLEVCLLTIILVEIAYSTDPYYTVGVLQNGKTIVAIDGSGRNRIVPIVFELVG